MLLDDLSLNRELSFVGFTHQMFVEVPPPLPGRLEVSCAADTLSHLLQGLADAALQFSVLDPPELLCLLMRRYQNA